MARRIPADERRRMDRRATAGRILADERRRMGRRIYSPGKTEGGIRRMRKRVWKRMAAAAMTGALLLQAAGCGNVQKGSEGSVEDLSKEQESTGPEEKGGTDIGEAGRNRKVADADRPEPEGKGLTAEYDQEELEEDWEEESAVILTCSGTKAQIQGNGAYEEEGKVRIASGGTYILRGDYQGQICVDAGKEDEVRLILDQFSITCPDSAPIYGLQSKRIILTLAEGTENRVADGSTYVNAAAGEDGPDGAIFSKDDLTINGRGKLEVQGDHSNGIFSKDDLTIISGEIRVTAVKDGIKGKDSVSVRDGVIRVESGEDGIKASNDQDAEKGYVIVEGGDIQITAGDDGIHAETWLTIHDGTILIDKSYEGIEGRKVDINGGKIDVTASDDGINGAGAEGAGNSAVRKGMDPGAARESESGEDPGAAREPESGEDPGAVREQESGQEEGQEIYVRITGGEITVDSGADGIDSNGDVYVHGGTVYINGPVSRGDGALDYDGRALISGGTFAAAGSTGMMQAFSEASSQRMLMVYHDQSQAGGTAVSLTTGQGEEIFSWSPAKDFECILISLAELEEGGVYTLRTGQEVQEIVVEGMLTQSGERSGGPGGSGGPGMGDRDRSRGRGPGRDGGERPEPPEGGDRGERPELPEGSDRGERPELSEGGDRGERAEPPEGSDRGERPAQWERFGGNR